MEQNLKAPALNEGEQAPLGLLDLPRELRDMIYSYIGPLTRMDRIREYMFLRCHELLSKAVSYRLKDRSLAQIAQQLDEEEKTYEQWKAKQAHIEILMSLKPERPPWLYATPRRTLPKTRRPNEQTRKELVSLLRANDPEGYWDVDQMLWEIRECARCPPDLCARKGGLQQLLEEKNHDELFLRIRADREILESMTSGDDPDAAEGYRDSISCFVLDHFETIYTYPESGSELVMEGQRWRYKKRVILSRKELARQSRRMRAAPPISTRFFNGNFNGNYHFPNNYDEIEDPGLQLLELVSGLLGNWFSSAG
ncbi:MAG: hypothetical protein HETSPECPRED_009293 [Heterodermia speciosa]|uniref:Uncharacterized protein n=1 Tax=Heterodermia speciosa TaxID=116794 RepID=A0A8H3G4V7_9LECA|nr:MAG: hypothetical protein HETSPECPRED_009293 [Heterodermia speciosa]